MTYSDASIEVNCDGKTVVMMTHNGYQMEPIQMTEKEARILAGRLIQASDQAKSTTSNSNFY